MRRSILLISAISLVVVGLLSLASCKKPKDEVDVNIINFSNTQFKIDKGYKWRYAENRKDNLFSYRVYLMSEGLSLDLGNKISDDEFAVTGSGSLITFKVHSKSGFDIAAGEYPLDGWHSKDSTTAEDCKVMIDYNFDAQDGSLYDLPWGSFKFTNLGNSIKIKVNLQDKLWIDPYAYDTILTFRGYFYGTLEDINKML